MKRKAPLDLIPAPVRIVRSKIEVIDPNDDTSTSLSAASSRSTATIVADASEDTDATSISESDDESLSESSDSSSSDDISSTSDSDAEDSELDEMEEEARTATTISVSGNGKRTASAYVDSTTGVTTLRMGTKPVIDASLVGSSSSVLKRLRRLLPELEKSNEVLATEAADGSIGTRIINVHDEDGTSSEDDEGDSQSGPYIEMDLGLGVLEEQSAISASTLGADAGIRTVESKVTETLFGSGARSTSGIQDICDETMQ